MHACLWVCRARCLAAWGLNANVWPGREGSPGGKKEGRRMGRNQKVQVKEGKGMGRWTKEAEGMSRLSLEDPTKWLRNIHQIGWKNATTRHYLIFFTFVMKNTPKNYYISAIDFESWRCVSLVDFFISSLDFWRNRSSRSNWREERRRGLEGDHFIAECRNAEAQTKKYKGKINHDQFTNNIHSLEFTKQLCHFIGRWLNHNNINHISWSYLIYISFLCSTV